MALPTAKELTKLAKACRKLGITQFEGEGIKFTLDLSLMPQKASKASSMMPQKASYEQEEVETDGWESLSDEAKIAWSAGITPENN